MVAVAKNDPFKGFTLKAVLASMILEGSTLKQIETAVVANFPRRFSKAASVKKIPKTLVKILRTLHRGKLKYDKVETTHVAPPTEAIKIKGVEFEPPASFLKSKAKKEKVAKKAEKSKTKNDPKSKKLKKNASKKTSSDDEDVEVVE